MAVSQIVDYFTPREPLSESVFAAAAGTIAGFFSARSSGPTAAEAAASHAARCADRAMSFVVAAASFDACSAAREAYYASHSSPRTTYAAASAAYREVHGFFTGDSNEVYYAARSTGRRASKMAETACYLRQFDKLADLSLAGGPFRPAIGFSLSKDSLARNTNSA